MKKRQDYTVVYLGAAMRGFGKIMMRQRLLYVRMAYSCYRLHHRRLPGSDSTARLRKKRHTRVMKWSQRKLFGKHQK